jgi:hypothetical protein
MYIHPSVLLFALIPIAGIIYFIYQFKNKGMKGAFFGGKVLNTHGEFELSKRGILSGNIKVHEIESKPTNLVGIEITQNTLASYDMTALTFEKSDIKQLIEALEKCAK